MREDNFSNINVSKSVHRAFSDYCAAHGIERVTFLSLLIERSIREGFIPPAKHPPADSWGLVYVRKSTRERMNDYSIPLRTNIRTWTEAVIVQAIERGTTIRIELTE